MNSPAWCAIQFNTASPYTNARGRIRKWKKEKNLWTPY
ncbi:ClbS/DfsB family four-helix bundle protein [Elizabethkingia sp. YR214]|nr:ClbS/DfsB family four-helix bundle protein [Elizabethkingia sp. YR214]